MQNPTLWFKECDTEEAIAKFIKTVFQKGIAPANLTGKDDFIQNEYKEVKGVACGIR